MVAPPLTEQRDDHQVLPSNQYPLEGRRPRGRQGPDARREGGRNQETFTTWAPGTHATWPTTSRSR